MLNTNSHYLDNCFPTDKTKGVTIWLKNNNQVNNYELNKLQQKEFKIACGEADRKERWLDTPVDVIINKVKEEVLIRIEVRQ